MIELHSWPGWLAPLLNAIALLLALGFRRNRAVVVLAVLTFSSLAVADGMVPGAVARGADATRMFAPWLLLVAAVLPERGLLSRRNLVVFLLLLLAAWLTVAAPAHVWPGLREALPFGMLPWRPGVVAAALTFAAAGFCVLRWVLVGSPMEAGLAIVLALGGAALLPSMRADATRMAFALAGAGALFSVLYASYRMAFVDALSGLPNRRALDETLARLGGGFALAMVDVDHFKRFNDTHGHAAGDRVLQVVAAQLRRTRSARAFRYGGEEFCLLFSGRRSRVAASACEEARRRVESGRVRVRTTPSRQGNSQAVRRGKGGGETSVTVSIGLASRDNKTITPSEVLKAADQALYRAKSKGRNRVVSK